MNIVTVFMVLQTILVLFMTFHDWRVLPTNIRELEESSKKVHCFFRLFNFSVPLFLTWYYQTSFSWLVLIFYGSLSLYTIFFWWIPYFFGRQEHPYFFSSQEHKRIFEEYKKNHHFLPARGNNIIPSTLHVFIHVQIWICFGISIYLLMHR